MKPIKPSTRKIKLPMIEDKWIILPSHNLDQQHTKVLVSEIAALVDESYKTHTRTLVHLKGGGNFSTSMDIAEVELEMGRGNE